MAWTHYVYELTDSDGNVAYVGKGSGRRLDSQIKRYGLIGNEVARFKSEKSAYEYEIKRIADQSPYLNKCAGGNGNRTKRVSTRKTDFEKLCDLIGTRAVAARLWLVFARSDNADMSKVDAIREVAYG